MPRRVRFTVVFATLVMLAALLALAVAALFLLSRPPPAEQVTDAAQQLLPAQPPQQQGRFRPEDIPSWLFGHVAIIAGLQVISVLAAGAKAARRSLTARDRAVIQFLIEIPMFLGLFGTLLGVCLTQFLSGTLVAPLAYLTTMSGIILHIFGKLTIALPISAGEPDED